MEQNTKKNLIFGGSIASAALIGLGAGLGIGFGTTGGSNNSSETQLAANVKGIGAFANLESFDNNGLNYGIRKAALEYQEGNSSVVGKEEQFSVEEKTSQYTDDGAIYVDMLEDFYSTNDIIISSGFQVANALMGTENFGGLYTDSNGNNTNYANSRTKAFVLMDEDILAQNYTNAASISFAAEGAGYMAGIAAAAYTQYDVTERGLSEGNIVMWGGENFTSIIAFLAGFEQAINEYNDAGTGVHITLWSGGMEDGDTYESDDFTSSSENSDHWYTRGFDADAETVDGELAKIKTNNAIKNGASIVFPVAGGNTTVAEDAVAEANNNITKIIGVDADATISANHPELFLGTAEKNLTTGGQYGLWAMDDFDGNGQRNYEELMIKGADAYLSQNPDDTYFTTHKDNIISWHEAGVESIGGVENEVGVILTGTAENGGVGFMLGGEANDLDTAWIEEFANSFGFDDLDEMENAISTIATEAPTINSTSDTFTK